MQCTKKRSVESANRLFETYNIFIIPHGKNIFQAAYDMSTATMFAYTSSNYALPHWKCVLRCCENFLQIDLQILESDYHNSNVSPTIIFNEYQHIARCTMHDRIHFN